MGKRWRIQAHDADRILALERGAGISPIVAQLLVSRGITDLKQVQSFLDPKLTGLRDPEDLPGVTDAANLIHAAISAKRKIVVYGDYDADGMTGADRKSTRLNSSHVVISYAVFCLKKKIKIQNNMKMFDRCIS